MCGFVGYYGKGSDGAIKEAAQKISHRGPDLLGVRQGAGWGVAFDRLSIIDLTDAAMQPFENKDCIVYLNGEIYNYLELQIEHVGMFSPNTKSDVEIIPFLYSKYGLNFLNKLNGMFAMAIIDKNSGHKYLIRDRFGKKPIFYKKNSDGVVFGSEIKAIRSLTPVFADRDNVLINLSCWMLPAPLSLFSDVFALRPGCYLEVMGGNDIKENIWYKPKISDSGNKFCDEEFLELFFDAVKIRTRADVPIGIFLSGGMDSTLIAQMVQKSNNDLIALRANIEHKEMSGDGDVDIYNPTRFCDDFGIKSYEININFNYWNENICSIANNFEEIFLDSGSLIYYALGKLASKNGIKVVFTGNGGDEIFGGYPWQSYLFRRPAFLDGALNGNICMQDIIEKVLIGFPNSRFTFPLIWLSQLCLFPSLLQIQSICSIFEMDLLRSSKSARKRLRALALEMEEFGNQPGLNLDIGNKVNYSNFINTIAIGNYASDMGPMAFSVESRTPFLDYRVVEYMMSIPHSEKIKLGNKSLLRNAAKNLLPDYITKAKKGGPTMPLSQWFTGERLTQARQFILKNRALIGDFLGGQFADSWCNTSRRGEGNRNMDLFALISLVIWLKINVANEVFPSNTKFTDIL